MTLLLVDGNNLLMRSIHAMGRSGLTSSDGVPTGPLLGFINTLSKHVVEEKPDRLVVCWDGGRSEYRVALDPEYKAHRLAMEPDAEEHKRGSFALAKEFCTLAGIHHVERTGVEADDVIAYYWRRAEPGDKVVILSSDKDFLQLVREDRVEQVRLSSAGTPTDRWTWERVVTEMGCAPEDLASAMALAGDTSDNVPGVPRFGMKTAVKTLAAQNWSLGDLVRDHPRVAPYAERVEKNLALVDLTRQLAGLELPALPLFDPTRPGKAMFPHLVTFLRRYQMNTVLVRISESSMWE